MCFDLLKFLRLFFVAYLFTTAGVSTAHGDDGPCFWTVSKFGARELYQLDHRARLVDLGPETFRAVGAYILQFPHPTNFTKEASYTLIEQLARMNFNGPGPFRVWFILEEELGIFRIHSFTLAAFLISGWKQIGMIRADGRWNLDLSPEDIIARFEHVTGWRRVSRLESEAGDNPLGIQSQIDYAHQILASRLAFEDVHDYLFHVPFLLDPIRRRFAVIAFNFDIIRNIIDGSESYMNGLFEYSGSSDGEVLYGPIQLLSEVFPPREASESEFTISRALQTLWRRPMKEIRKVRQRVASFFPILEPEEKSWDLALQMMKVELEAVLKNLPRRPTDKSQNIQRLVRDIDSLRHDLEVALSKKQ